MRYRIYDYTGPVPKIHILDDSRIKNYYDLSSGWISAPAYDILCFRPDENLWWL